MRNGKEMPVAPPSGLPRTGAPQKITFWWPFASRIRIPVQFPSLLPMSDTPCPLEPSDRCHQVALLMKAMGTRLLLTRPVE